MSHFSERFSGDMDGSTDSRAGDLLISYANAPSSENLAKLLSCLCEAGDVKNAITLIKKLPEQPLSAIDQKDISSLKDDIVASEGENEQKLLILDNLANAVRAIKNSLK